MFIYCWQLSIFIIYSFNYLHLNYNIQFHFSVRFCYNCICHSDASWYIFNCINSFITSFTYNYLSIQIHIESIIGFYSKFSFSLYHSTNNTSHIHIIYNTLCIVYITAGWSRTIQLYFHFHFYLMTAHSTSYIFHSHFHFRFSFHFVASHN